MWSTAVIYFCTAGNILYIQHKSIENNNIYNMRILELHNKIF